MIYMWTLVRTVIFIFFSFFATAQISILSPGEFLPHDFGKEFTPHHSLVNYFNYVAENSPHILFENYGLTNEDRPLTYAIISSIENIRNLQQIQDDNLRRALEKEGDILTKIPIVWLSYGVHGNEAGASESAIATIYELATLRQPGLKEWLEKVIVILDPCINPDGYSRYTSWNRSASNLLLTPDPLSREHNEPWPGGRVNHYLFDLNRDWAWLTQVESQQRIKLYQEWIPQVHVDFHEMGHNDPYYFAPAAKPFHQYISQWQGDFQKYIGKNHAKYFDAKGWHYFTKEEFDLFYPSYGDTYPTFNGAIGMTYEQAGHGIAGKGIHMDNGDTLRLEDRIAHHLTTSLSTIETAAMHANELADNFHKFYLRNSETPPGRYKAYLISAENPGKKISALCNFLDQHKIRYSFVEKGGAKLSGWNYQKFDDGDYLTKKGDLVVSSFQPKSILTQVLFEPDPTLEDSLTYDITAWALPYAFGLKAFASTRNIVSDNSQAKVEKQLTPVSGNCYAAIVPWRSIYSAEFVGHLFQHGVKMRMATADFSIEGESYPMGTVVINAADNKHHSGPWTKVVNKVSEEMSYQIVESKTGYSDAGPDLGSGKFVLLDKPKVLVMGGEKIQANDFGQVWYFMEQVIKYPLTVVEPKNFDTDDLKNFNTLILPSGRYSFSEVELGNIKDWASQGGRVIAIGASLRNFAGKDGFELKRKETVEGKKEDPVQKLYSGKERDFLKNFIPGAIFKVNMDISHPMAAGFDKEYFSLKTNNRAYQLMEKGWNIGIVQNSKDHVGFAGHEALEKLNNSLVLGVERKGKGDFVYFVDNPLFRSFWREGARLFANTVCLHPK